MENTAKLNLSPKTIDTAEGTGRKLLEQAKAQSGFVPNMYAGMVNSPGLLETYLLGYERFRKESGFSPVEQEVVLLTISRFHGCTYCMAAHSMIAAKMSKVPTDVLEALRSGGTLPDHKLQALSRFTELMLEHRGRPKSEDLEEFERAGYNDRHVLEIILAIAVKTISNYSNHVLHTQTDAPFQGYAWSAEREAEEIAAPAANPGSVGHAGHPATTSA